MERMLDSRGRPRIVITGMGVMSPLGHSTAESWDSLLNGRSGIGSITHFDVDRYDFPTRIAGEIKQFNAKDHMDFKEARRMSLVSQYAVAATRMALTDARLPEPVPCGERTGVLVGTGAGGFEVADQNLIALRHEGIQPGQPVCHDRLSVQYAQPSRQPHHRRDRPYQHRRRRLRHRHPGHRRGDGVHPARIGRRDDRRRF